MMNPSVYPESVQRLIRLFQKLPTIGAKSAERLALAALKWPSSQVSEFAEALTDAKSRIHDCPICGNMTDQEICLICQNPHRDRSLLCVVASVSELARLERSGMYRGVYHVLGGHLSPLQGIGPDDLRVDSLIQRVKDGMSEVILAFTPNDTGEATANYVASELVDTGVKMTRLARGIPMGADLEYADDLTIAGALERREQLEFE